MSFNLRVPHALFFVTLLVLADVVKGGSIGAELGHSVKPQEALVPDRDIAYATSKVSKWKAIWDTARELSRKGQFEKALQQFALLLANKPNLDEARWEYTSILLHLEHWQAAEAELNLLKADGSDNPDYMFARAEIALHRDNLPLAVKLYSKLYVEFTNGRKGVKALDGLTRSLIAQGKHGIALPLVEQLMLRRPQDVSVRRRAALVLEKVGNTEEAVKKFQEIYPLFRHDAVVLAAYASCLAKNGRPEASSALLQEVYALTPYNPEINRLLADYYQKSGNEAMELRHLEVLASVTTAPPELLENIIRLNLSLGRIDKALQVCNSIFSLSSEYEALAELYQQVLRALAIDLLALVENSGAELLWNDLQGVTKDRLKVFTIMASLLREQGKLYELADVLLVMVEEVPENDPLLKELEALLVRQGRTDELAGLNHRLLSTETKLLN